MNKIQLKANYYQKISLFLALLILGMSLNFLVIVENKGKMPVYNHNNYLEQEGYILFNNFNEVNYPYLSDRFYIINPDYYLFSIGDIIMFISTFLIFYYSIRLLFLKYWREK